MDVPKIVTDTATQRWPRRRFLGGAVSVTALASFATACSSGAAQPQHLHAGRAGLAAATPCQCLHQSRPPGGNYDETTIQMAGKAGLKGVMLWKEAMEITDMEYHCRAPPQPGRHHPHPLPRPGTARRRVHDPHDDPALPAHPRPGLHRRRHHEVRVAARPDQAGDEQRRRHLCPPCGLLKELEP